MSTENLDVATRMRRLVDRAAERARELGRVLADRGSGPLPGDLYAFDIDVEVSVLWAVIKPHPDGDDVHLVIPADTNPLTGTADVRVPEVALCGPLTLRCDRAQWVP